VEPTSEYFERDESFDLDEFARASFGVFHDDPVDVVWKFSPRAAPDAKDFIFHPDQKLEPQKDGSLIVKFKAGGQLEMCWHLFAWGKDVEVLQPESLANMLHPHRPKWPGLP
jgi:predicted DNA-binding transcriptional regulator YafY